MTEFRSRGKGKDRQVYPVNKQKAYGVARQLAYEDVVKLRDHGKRARLIRTNQKLDLYAPYESTLPGPSIGQPSTPAMVKNTTPEKENKPHQEQQGSQRNNLTPGQEVDLNGILGILSPKGTPNLTLKDKKRYFDEGLVGGRIEDGDLTFTSVDPERISMIKEAIPTDLPDGYLSSAVVDGNFKLYWSPTPPEHKPMKYPQLSYEPEKTWTVRLEGQSLSEFLSYLKNPVNDSTRIALEGNAKKASVSIGYRYFNEDASSSTFKDVETVNAVTGNLSDSNNGGVSLPTEYLRSSIKALLGNREFNKPGATMIQLSIKQDYPIMIKTRRVGPNGEHIEAEALIAPRME